MAPLDAALNLRGNQQADGDGKEMKQKLPKAVQLVRQMNVEHRRANLVWIGPLRAMQAAQGADKQHLSRKRPGAYAACGGS